MDGQGGGYDPRRLTVEQVVELRAGYAAGVPNRELAERFGVSKATVSSVALGRRYRDVPGAWEGEPRGGGSRMAPRFSDQEIADIRAASAAGLSRRWIAKRFGVGEAKISLIATRQSYRHVPEGVAPSGWMRRRIAVALFWGRAVMS